MYKSNIQEVVLNLKGKLKTAQNISGLQREIATYLLGSNLRRIHNEGKDINETKIGNYNSTHELYVNPKKSPKAFPKKGKYGAIKFKNGKPHKTGYFPSYKGFRGAIGRETGTVNLQLSGKLYKSWVATQEGKDWLIGFISKYGSDVARGNEERFGKRIWGITKADFKKIKIIEQKFIKKALAKT